MLYKYIYKKIDKFIILFLFFQLKHLIINLDPDDEGNEDAGTPKVSKSIPSTPSNHVGVGSTPAQTPNTPNHNDVSNVSYESPEYHQKQVITKFI